MICNDLRTYYCVEKDGNLFFCDKDGDLFSINEREEFLKKYDICIEDQKIPFALFNINNSFFRVSNGDVALRNLFIKQAVILPDEVRDAFIIYSDIYDGIVSLAYGNNLFICNIDVTTERYDVYKFKGNLIGSNKDELISFDNGQLEFLMKKDGSRRGIKINGGIVPINIRRYQGEYWILSKDNRVYVYEDNNWKMIVDLSDRYDTNSFSKVHIINEKVILLPSENNKDILIMDKRHSELFTYLGYPKDFGYLGEGVKFDRCSESNGNYYYPNRISNYILKIDSLGELEWIRINSQRVLKQYSVEKLKKCGLIKESEYFNLKDMVRV